MLQVLWCPNWHEWPFFGPKPYTFWRRAADVSSVLTDPPLPVFDSNHSARDHYPVPCVLYPERVTEYPDYEDLPGDLRERVEEWDDEQAGEDEDGDPFPGPYLTDLVYRAGHEGARLATLEPGTAATRLRGLRPGDDPPGHHQQRGERELG